MHDRIARLYLNQQIELWSFLFPSEHTTQKRSNEFISNHTLSIKNKRRTTQFPCMNLCFDMIICTKFLHYRCLFRENQYLFLFFEKLHQLRKCIALDILYPRRRMGRINYLIYLYRCMLTTNPLKIRCEIESESEGLWLFSKHTNEKSIRIMLFSQ